MESLEERHSGPHLIPEGCCALFTTLTVPAQVSATSSIIPRDDLNKEGLAKGRPDAMTPNRCFARLVEAVQHA